jgi:hypothetical protein
LDFITMLKIENNMSLQLVLDRNAGQNNFFLT